MAMETQDKYQKLRQKAEKLLKEKGVERPEKFYDDIDKLVEELNIHQIELEMQNQELQEANQKLTDEQNRYKDLYMNAPVAYFTLNRTGNIIELNHAAAHLLKSPIQGFRFTSIFPYLHENSKKDFSGFFKTVFNSEKTEYGEIVFLDKNQEKIYANLSATAYFDDRLNQNLVRCTVNDISNIKQFEDTIETQKQLLDSENRMRTLFEKNGVPMLIIESETGQIEYANPAASEFYGYQTTQLQSMNIADINQMSPIEIRTEMDNTRQSGKKYFNFRHKLANGKIRDVEVYSNAIDFGESTKLFSIIHDITERYKTEITNKELNSELKTTIEELHTANEELNTTNEELNTVNEEVSKVNTLISAERQQFLSILDSIPEIIYVSDLKTNKILFANQKLKKFVGRDITGEKCYNAIQAKGEVCDFCTNKYIATTNELYFWEYYNPILEKHFYIMDRKIVWTDKKEVRFELAIDVTARKKSEEKLNKLNAKLKATVEELSTANEELNTTIEELNTVNEELYNKNTEIELSNERLESLLSVSQFPTNSIQELLNFALDEAIRLTESKIGYIYFYNAQNRQFILNSWSKDVMKECKITEPQTVYDLDKTGIWGEAVRQKKAILVNDYRAENPLKKGTPQGHVALTKFLTIPVIFDNKIVAVIGVGNKANDYNDADIRQLTLLMDSVWKISERLVLIKDLEIAKEKAEESEQNLKEAQKIAQLGNWELDIVNNHLYWSDEIYRIFDCKPQEFEATYNAFLEFIHPDDRQSVNDAYTHSIENKQPYEIIHRLLTKSGKRKYVKEKCITTFDDNGKPMISRGIVLDITDQKMAEEALRNNSQRFKDLFDNLPIAYQSLDENGYFLDINKDWSEITGFTFEDIAQKKFDDLWTPETRYSFPARFNEFVEQGFIDNAEISLLNEKNEKKHILLTGRVQVNEKNEFEKTHCAIIDITERKQIEEALKESEEKYRLITENASDVIWILNLTQQKYTYISPSVYTLRGFTSEEAMQQDISQSLTAESAKLVLESISEILPQFLANPAEESKKVHRHELRQPCKDGSIIWIETTTRYQLNADNEVEVIGISRNIDDRKKQQQRIENHLRYVENVAHFSNTLLLEQPNAVNNSLKYILEAAQCGRVYIFENFIDQQNRLSMKQTHEVCAPGIKPEIDNPDLQHLIYDEDGFGRWKKVLTQNGIINEIVANMPDCERLILETQDIKSILAIPIYVQQKWFGFIGFDDTYKQRKWHNEDIDLLRTAAEILGLYLQNKSARQQIIKQNQELTKQESELKEALETKEVLLKEVHHRVKNNLQTISSLLYQQQTLAGDTKIAEALRDSMNRVSTMALIHQFIYKSDDLQNINMKNYIYDLVGKLANTYNQRRQTIILQIEIDEIYFDIEKTIPVALIVNEVLSNIYKYAFDGKENGTINVKLTKNEDGKNKMLLSDNGVGFPNGFEPHKSKSLGMYLIKNFAKRQLKGTLLITSKPNEGVKYEIEF